MIPLHLDYQGKTARVSLQSLPAAKPKPALAQKTACGPVQVLKIASGLNTKINPAALRPEQLIEGDPELNIAGAGRILHTDDLSVAYFNPEDPEPKPIGDFKEIDIIYTPAGEEKERRPHLTRKSNLDEIHPVKLGKRLPLVEGLTSFVFKGILQLVHEDGVTRDFLYSIAKELHEKQELAVLGAGPKGNQPLVVRDRGNPYRAFLYGETGSGPQADEYKLLLLLSDQELKRPAEPAA